MLVDAGNLVRDLCNALGGINVFKSNGTYLPQPHTYHLKFLFDLGDPLSLGETVSRYERPANDRLKKRVSCFAL